jgi:hypothetical protein
MKITIKSILLPVITFFTPVAGILSLLVALIIVDTITGVWRSKKLGVPVTSKGLSAFISKVFLYCSSVLLIYSVDYLLLNELMLMFFSVDLLITKVISMIFAFVELISINENWKEVKGFDLWERARDLTKRAKVIKKEFADFNKIKKQ